MKRFAIHALAAAALVAGPLAQAEIVKCVDKAGRVTLTDMPCNGSAFVVQSGATTPAQLATQQATITAEGGYQEQAAPPDPLRVGAVRIHLSPSEFGPSGSAKARYARMTRPAASQTFMVDSATLRAARTSLSDAPIGGTQVAAR